MAVRRRLPNERKAITHKFTIGDSYEGYITVGEYEDGAPGEIFLTDIGKGGSTLHGMMSSWAISISIGLQHGIPLEDYVSKYAFVRFEPEGRTNNPEIPVARSMVDYIMRWLASKYLDVDTQDGLGVLTPMVKQRMISRADEMEIQSASVAGMLAAKDHGRISA